MKWRFVYFPHLSSVYFPNPVLQTDSGVNNAIAKWLNRIRRVCWAAAAILEKTDAGSDWSHKKRRLCCETAIQYATDFCFSNSHATRLCVFLDPPHNMLVILPLILPLLCILDRSFTFATCLTCTVLLALMCEGISLLKLMLCASHSIQSSQKTGLFRRKAKATLSHSYKQTCTKI